MIISRFVFQFLTVVGCAAAAYVISRHIRQLEKRQLKENVRTWEGEGGRLAPSEAPDARPGADRGASPRFQEPGFPGAPS